MKKTKTRSEIIWESKINTEKIEILNSIKNQYPIDSLEVKKIENQINELYR